jgi:hypothetical protein
MAERRVIWCYLFLALALTVLSAFLLAAAGQLQPQLPSVQAMDVQQTPNGPTIQGLFGRFTLPIVPLTPPPPGCDLPVCTYPKKLYAGSACDNKRSVAYNCYPCAAASICAPPKKDSDCCCQCIETLPPNCNGCPAVGYCKKQ